MVLNKRVVTMISAGFLLCSILFFQNCADEIKLISDGSAGAVMTVQTSTTEIEMPQTSTTLTSTTQAAADFCTQYPNVSRTEIPYAGAAVATENFGHLHDNGVFVIKLTIPANATGPLNLPSVWDYAEHGTYMPVVERMITLSVRPCDFRGYIPGMQWLPPTDPTGVNGPIAWSTGNQGAMNYQLDNQTGNYPKLRPGGTYYLNIRNNVWTTGESSCPTIYCDMKLMHRPPT